VIYLRVVTLMLTWYHIRNAKLSLLAINHGILNYGGVNSFDVSH
jgi:hypothetical protein